MQSIVTLSLLIVKVMPLELVLYIKKSWFIMRIMEYTPNAIKTRYYFKETPFEKLMSNRIREILLVCSKYDKFMLEEDGRIDEQLFQEYVSLSLRYPPKFTQVSTAEEALDTLDEKYYDLIIVMLSIGNSSALDLAEKIKSFYPSKPIILLTPVSTRETMLRLKTENFDTIDYLFSWQGNSNIMLAMVKLIEDKIKCRSGHQNRPECSQLFFVEDSVKILTQVIFPWFSRPWFRTKAREIFLEKRGG